MLLFIACAYFVVSTMYSSHTQNFYFFRGGKKGRNVAISTVNPPDLGPKMFLTTLPLEHQDLSYKSTRITKQKCTFIKRWKNKEN
jgi:hypothetical protein